ncbi:aminodeoxychorismate lyase [Serinibacter salmoneus]|uniref:4-amino-4-deoxychorismate lyase n=1 Tax=Serinibacter salmoneus TaxID=556530 RepID=A0A2A9D4X4_9MICO|nr:aminodeoxychorismate lyase [Serinibacter salmoneus]PFG20899.1 4-amino-4-deoxychorismate lyase [Serinibacter salmoneus]
MATATLVMIDRPTRGQIGGDGAPYRREDPLAPQLRVTDLAVTRGDGIFETAMVREGRILAEERHLRRLARSAAMLDLPEPDLEVYRDATRAAVAAFGAAAEGMAEGMVKYCLSRGDEELGTGPVGWAYAGPTPDFSAAREEGIAVVLLDRGLSTEVPETAPWLLAGVKTLAYAVNKAALREARRRGAQDVVFVSTDGLLLEGPTSTLIVRVGDALVTPRPQIGVLPGTTQEDVFAQAPAWGLRTEYRDVRESELLAADGAWLTSSTRLACPIRRVDGADLAVDVSLTSRMNALLTARTA